MNGIRWAANGSEDVEKESITPSSHPIRGNLGGLKIDFNHCFHPRKSEHILLIIILIVTATIFECLLCARSYAR